MANKINLNLSGGMNTKTSSLIIKDSESELVLNYNLDKIGSLTRRNGYIRYCDQPKPNLPVDALWNWGLPSGANYHFMSVANAGLATRTIYYNLNAAATWTVTNLTTDTNSAIKTRFASFIGYTFRTNGVDAMSSTIDGAAWGTTNCLTGGGIAPRAMAVYQARLYAADNAVARRSRIYFSSLPDPSTYAITWDTTNDMFDVNPSDGDYVTALENNGNRLLIFKSRALYRWTYGQVEADRLIGVGTSSPESVKTNFDVGITFFANQRGIYGYSGDRPKLLSRKIQPFIDAVSDWDNVVAEVDTDHYYLGVGDITVSGRTYANAILVYHISLDAWSIYTTATRVNCMANMVIVNPVQNIYFGGLTTGRTYQLFTGNNDDSSTISSEWISKEYTLSYPNRTNLAWLDIFASQQVATSVFLDLDRLNQFSELGQLFARISNFRAPVRECNTFRAKLADNSTNISVIEGFNVEHLPKEKRDEPAVKLRRQYG